MWIVVILGLLVGFFVLVMTIVSMDSKLKRLVDQQERLLNKLDELTGNPDQPKH